ncbi:MAG: CHAP domain-containing protein [Muribaculaceae bacterium]|nr:CHAP domain-containing protein [Muribaculaceae bacterium]
MGSGFANALRGNIFSNKSSAYNLRTPGMNFSPITINACPNFQQPSCGVFIAPNLVQNNNPIQIIGAPGFMGSNRINIFGKDVHSKQKNTATSQTPSSTTQVKQTGKTNVARAAASSGSNAVKKQNKTDLRADFLTTSRRYYGYNEADGSSRVISKSPEWCADFIKFVINKTYREKGLTPPTYDLQIEPGMPHLRVENIKQWGINNGTYLPVAGKGNKADIIRNKVKPGDVIILRENGASHTGFVTKVYADGSFDSIEGNRNDRVATAHYSAYNPSLSGFVQVRS